MSQPTKSIISKNRFEALSDAVFAITMTLMILDLKIPDNISSNISHDELSSILLELLYSSETYIISFVILGIFWVRQQVQFDYVKSVNMRVLIINIFFLLIIGFVPFSVSSMRRYPDHELPFLIYIINLLLISLILFFHWTYASKDENIISDEVGPQVKKQFFILSLIPVLIFTLALLVSFANRRIALYIVYLDPLSYFVYRYFIKQKAA